jgi:hypothetical protein
MPAVTVPCSVCEATLRVQPQSRRFACSRCGAVLALREAGGVLFTEAVRSGVAAVLPGPPGRPAVPDDRAERLRLRGELSRLEEEWSVEQQGHYVREGPGIVSILFTVLIGLVAVPLSAVGILLFDAPDAPLYGIPFVAIALSAFALVLLLDVRRALRARAYRRAEAEYQRRRRALLERLGEG